MSKNKFNTIVIKVGSSSLTTSAGKLDLENLKRIVAEIAKLCQAKKKVVLVTSGAIVAGAEKLALGKPKTIPEKQAAAAVGQARLMRQYEKAFEEFGLTVAQVLLTRDAIADRERYLNARNTLLTLLAEKVVPIINENDTVAIDEIKIGDNDNLAALAASLIGADLLALLTDVDGFYMNNEEGISYLVPEIKTITKDVESAAGHSSTQLGTGGMITKIQAAKICSAAGVHMSIINARKDGLINKIANGGKAGTLFIPEGSKLESRKRWLAHGLQVEGTLIVDAGAESALLKKGTSLLPIGIKKITGSFKAGSLVSIRTETQKEVARGLAALGHEELKELIGKKDVGEAVHRDNLVIL
ncbi:glutamate 5-kinase [candidate division WOR-1 bacterium RIFOXYB2_FULL_42_35]|uniref:Glutamate 5-kinase n=1 Tax=candidate division WOR-1 bacterium RIFOXYC2_FULL_41_25 TaxID=1802586 RepID=A0A1F4TN55_UNCSA|nr:MAG: glutamate 5-kinase [candidate division WOR-1 bacterium RIFOXYA2_FULL_41_14]OGC23035.1 MAG: glutamate 5-kinase [candidate division WOR-1 bacterium RIFOXYB2_FULL_42_35]OGC33493.1 MAG: glutamate 5-kinase [candidate division WOR-1 bacterium RIFOXYC2_FULL_41_25]OGC44060.1 MAG: glutamate 5-kinase [candidate division WOR-1 bacterium RIFOXYD2_FULL_41_8]